MQAFRINRPLAFFFLTILALRALLPAGYMPDLPALQAGVFKVTLCTGTGPRQVTLDGAMQPVAPHKGGAARTDLCAFAGLIGTAILTALPAVIVPILSEARASKFFAAPTPEHSRRLYAARAPPFL